MESDSCSSETVKRWAGLPWPRDGAGPSLLCWCHVAKVCHTPTPLPSSPVVPYRAEDIRETAEERLANVSLDSEQRTKNLKENALGSSVLPEVVAFPRGRSQGLDASGLLGSPAMSLGYPGGRLIQFS